MHIKEVFSLKSGQDIKITKEITESLETYAEKMSNILFNPFAVPEQKVEYISIKSEKSLTYLYVRPSEVAAYKVSPQ
ncbi:hypothetical protein P4H71_25820 [Paenibacillus kribbensis]|uniref:Alp7A family actin-like protein n=1 Tax=Paenibacillus kribbensis TaxID=172713 RepID=UPI002DBFF082|nr:hypothetical protein [Paenibacillus kribbensis]MEC0237738.1 hypothetical protein [Paenibacillus kribbensis]